MEQILIPISPSSTIQSPARDHFSNFFWMSFHHLYFKKSKGRPAFFNKTHLTFVLKLCCYDFLSLLFNSCDSFFFLQSYKFYITFYIFTFLYFIKHHHNEIYSHIPQTRVFFEILFRYCLKTMF